MQKFEDEYQCYIEPNEEMATIFVYSSKESSEKVRIAFEDLIKKIK